MSYNDKHKVNGTRSFGANKRKLKQQRKQREKQIANATFGLFSDAEAEQESAGAAEDDSDSGGYGDEVDRLNDSYTSGGGPAPTTAQMNSPQTTLFGQSLPRNLLEDKEI